MSAEVNWTRFRMDSHRRILGIPRWETTRETYLERLQFSLDFHREMVNVVPCLRRSRNATISGDPMLFGDAYRFETNGLGYRIAPETLIVCLEERYDNDPLAPRVDTLRRSVEDKTSSYRAERARGACAPENLDCVDYSSLTRFLRRKICLRATCPTGDANVDRACTRNGFERRREGLLARSRNNLQSLIW